MNNLRVAVIGAGYLGQYHAQKYAQMPDVDLVGVVDVDRDRAREIAQQYGTSAYFNHRSRSAQESWCESLAKVSLEANVLPHLRGTKAGHACISG